MRQTNDPTSSCAAGGRNEDTDLLASGLFLLATVPGLRTCLDAVPHFAFSETGRRNLCARFYLSELGLDIVLAAYKEGGQNG